VLAGVNFLVAPIYNAVQFSYRVGLIPDELQGRVNSAVRMIAFGSLPLGSAVAGFLIEAIGAVPSVMIFSAIYIALAAVTTVNRHIRAARSAMPEDLPA
jgi:hypothetical protein